MLEPPIGGYTLTAMIRILGTVLAGLLGLFFGSFLNVCASRWPKGESVVRPRSHCRHCGRPLAPWENIPLVSWLALRGRCHTCKAWIGWRYPVVEFAVGALWASSAWLTMPWFADLHTPTLVYAAWVEIVSGAGQMIFLWLLVALAVFDAENLWLPDRLIWPGIGLGLVMAVARKTLDAFLLFHGGFDVWKHMVSGAVATWFLGAVVPAGGLVLIRILYLIVRHKEGIGMGDVKLMAVIGGWVGVRLAIFTFGFAVILGTLVALVWLVGRFGRSKDEPWGAKRLPFGTFLCVGATICIFWTTPVMAAWQKWFGGLGS